MRSNEFKRANPLTRFIRKPAKKRAPSAKQDKRPAKSAEDLDAEMEVS